MEGVGRSLNGRADNLTNYKPSWLQNNEIHSCLTLARKLAIIVCGQKSGIYAFFIYLCQKSPTFCLYFMMGWLNLDAKSVYWCFCMVYINDTTNSCGSTPVYVHTSLAPLTFTCQYVTIDHCAELKNAQFL